MVKKVGQDKKVTRKVTCKQCGAKLVWKRKCIEIGAKPNRCCGSGVAMPVGRWKAVCNGCTREFRRHRRPKHINNLYCAKCGRERGKLFWTARMAAV